MVNEEQFNRDVISLTFDIKHKYKNLYKELQQLIFYRNNPHVLYVDIDRTPATHYEPNFDEWIIELENDSSWTICCYDKELSKELEDIYNKYFNFLIKDDEFVIELLLAKAFNKIIGDNE
jgi:hypothetical protein